MTDRQPTDSARPSPIAYCRSRFSLGILAHGGVGAPKAYSPGCKKACEAGGRLLEDGAQAIEAVVEAVRVLEDDGRFNAGSGSTIRLDGKTVEMDASVMDSQGRIGAVIAIRDIRNPVAAAYRLVKTPHVALAGEGATLFARRQGLPPSNGLSPASVRRYRRLMRLIREDKLGERDERWTNQRLESLWNFDAPYPHTFPVVDTVGAVAIDKEGRFAAAVSTGGASPMLLGRVGDVPFVGCGFYAGEIGAVAVTGIGEEIVKKMLGKVIYDKVVCGVGLRQACREALQLFPETVPIGIIAITRNECVTIANRRMPAARVIVRDAF